MNLVNLFLPSKPSGGAFEVVIPRRTARGGGGGGGGQGGGSRAAQERAMESLSDSQVHSYCKNNQNECPKITKTSRCSLIETNGNGKSSRSFFQGDVWWSVR